MTLAGGLPPFGFRAVIAGTGQYLASSKLIQGANTAIAVSTAQLASSSNAASVSRLSASFATLGKQTRQLPKDLSKAALILGRMQFVLISVVAALATFGAPILFAAKFEDVFSKIAGLTDTPREAIADLKKEVLELSKATAISPQDLGTAAYFVLSSGIESVSIALEVLTNAAKASVGGLGETADIARTVTAVMNAYQLSAEQAFTITNRLVGIVNKGAAEPEELAKSIGRVIPLAAQMGVEFSQVGAVLANMTNVGISTERAVTGLIGIFSQLIRPTDRSRELFKALGLEITGFRKLVEEDFVGAMNLLFAATEGNEEIIAELFPDIRGLIGALAAFGKQGPKTEQIQRDLVSGFDFLSKAVEESEKTLRFAFNKALNDTRIAMIQLGTRSLPAMKSFFRGVSNFVEGARRELINFRREFGPTFTQLSENLKDLGRSFITIGGAIGKVFGLVRGPKALTESLKALTKQLDIIVPAIIAFIAVMVGARLVTGLTAVLQGILALRLGLIQFIGTLRIMISTMGLFTGASIAMLSALPHLAIAVGLAAAAFVATRFLIKRFTSSTDDASSSIRKLAEEATALKLPFIRLGLDEETAVLGVLANRYAETLIFIQENLDRVKELQTQFDLLNRAPPASFGAPEAGAVRSPETQLAAAQLKAADGAAKIFRDDLIEIKKEFDGIKGVVARSKLAADLEDAGVPLQTLNFLFPDLRKAIDDVGEASVDTFGELAASVQTPIDQMKALDDKIGDVLSSLGALRSRLEGIAGTETFEESQLVAQISSAQVLINEMEALARADGLVTDAERDQLDSARFVQETYENQLSSLQDLRQAKVDNLVANNSFLLSEESLLGILLAGNSGFDDQQIILEHLGKALDSARDAHIAPLVALYETLIETLNKEVVTKIDSKEVDEATAKVAALSASWAALASGAVPIQLPVEFGIDTFVDPANVANDFAAQFAAAMAAIQGSISSSNFVPTGGSAAEKNPFQEFINAEQAKELLLEIGRTGEVTWAQVGRLWSLGFKGAADDLAAFMRGELTDLKGILQSAFLEAGDEGMSALVGQILDGTIDALDALGLLEAGMVAAAREIIGILSGIADDADAQMDIIQETIQNGAATIQDVNKLFELGFTEEATDLLRFLLGQPSNIGGLAGDFFKRFTRGGTPGNLFPQFGDGGIVPRGVTTPAILHGPEAVIPLSGMNSLRSLQRAITGGGSEGIRSYGPLSIVFGQGDDRMENIVLRAVGAA